MLKTIALLAYMLGHSPGNHQAFEVLSPAVHNDQPIPITYTCRGGNHTIQLRWRGVPKRTQSLTLIMYDVDAPSENWYHWVVYNIPVRSHSMKSAFVAKDHADIGFNSWGHLHYDGPCPLVGEHRYIIRLYALDRHLRLGSKRPTPYVVEAYMRGHVIADTALMGLFTAPAK
ncbi:MAG: YbhB/YbcL family Raf kinase inhibitor-like protein [Gammaproteobacteria bacterium]|nr:YbhB/YbcL family Raf kinase inhibitor-like protein [Gammaproteobacteria bacterium]